MTIGISQKDVIAIFDDVFSGKISLENVERELKLKVKELDTWLPIGENAPKDRPLFLGRVDGFKCVGHYFISGGRWVDQSQNYVVVTHWKELPVDPKE